MRPSEIIDIVAASEVAAPARIERIYRALRLLGVIRQTGRGRFAAQLSLDDLVKVLIGSSLPLAVDDAAEVVRMLADLPYQWCKQDDRTSYREDGLDFEDKYLDGLDAAVEYQLNCISGPISSLANMVARSANNCLFELRDEYPKVKVEESDATFVIAGGPGLSDPTCQIRYQYGLFGRAVMFFGDLEDSRSWSGFRGRSAKITYVSIGIGIDVISRIGEASRLSGALQEGSSAKMKGWTKRTFENSGGL